MDSLRRKRKESKSCKSSSPISRGRKRVFYEDDHLRKSSKKCREGIDLGCRPGDPGSSCSGKKRDCVATTVLTAPPCGGLSSSDQPGRGLKRKLGCVEPCMRVGRKKKLEDEYVLGQEIGKGKFGSVRLCRSMDNSEEFACKTLLKSGGETVHREVEIMQHLSGHPGVVTLKAVFEDADSFHLVMEMCAGGRLLDHMSKEGVYSENRAANLLKELVSVIKYCHEMGVVHRDIKPENILLTSSGNMKLADFGLALRVTNGQKLTGLAGSPAYVAPEVLTGQYTEKVDIWGAGILLHGLLMGTLPFQGDSIEAVFEAIKTGQLDFDSGHWESISSLARDLLRRMLTRDVSKRMTADEVLMHPWIVFYTEHSSKALGSKLNLVGRDILNTQSIDVCVITALVPVNSLSAFDNPTTKSEEHDDSGCVDALTAAINRVRISEPKRSRLCDPTSPLRQECPSTMNSNILTAF